MLKLIIYIEIKYFNTIYLLSVLIYCIKNNEDNYIFFIAHKVTLHNLAKVFNPFLNWPKEGA